MPIQNPELKKIIAALNDEQHTLTIELPIDSSAIDVADVATLCEVIAAHENLSKISFDRAFISPGSAIQIFRTFMDNPNLTELFMPLYSTVISNGQRTLMDLQEIFNLELEHYNAPQQKNLDPEGNRYRKISKVARASAPSGVNKKRYTP